MVMKKKKSATKKPVKKSVKKVAKAKKVVAKKRTAKKMVKKPVKNSAAKKINKKIEKVKKMVKQKKPIKKVIVKLKSIKPVKKIAPQSATIVKDKKKDTLKAKPAPLSPSTSKKKQKSEKKGRDVINENNVMETAARSKKPTTLLGALEFTPFQAQSNEAYMNELQREHFRKILNAWKQQLMQDVDLTVGHLKEEAVFYADPVDRATQEEGFNLELRTRDRERRLIKKIEQSLDLLNTSEYGFCEDCGAEIGIRRLEARPTAVKCIDCKTFQEIREKQLGG